MNVANLEMLIGIVIAGLVFSGLSFVFQPMPVPALTALAAGLASHWLARKNRLGWTIAGAALGAVAGGMVHAGMHIAEGRTDPDEGLALHLGLDAAGGLALAGLTLCVALGLARLVARRIAARGSAPGGDR